MKVLFDTNVVLDVLLDREPHVDPASKLFSLVDSGRIDGAVCATTITTIYYIAAKSFSAAKAKKEIQTLLAMFEGASVDKQVLDAALQLAFPDYEDAVLHEAAQTVGADAIVTRDQAGFPRAKLPILAPAELPAAIAASMQ